MKASPSLLGINLNAAAKFRITQRPMTLRWRCCPRGFSFHLNFGAHMGESRAIFAKTTAPILAISNLRAERELPMPLAQYVPPRFVLATHCDKHSESERTIMSNEAEVRRCEDCMYWDNSVQRVNSQADTTGACRIKPPKIDKRTGALCGVYRGPDGAEASPATRRKDPSPF